MSLTRWLTLRQVRAALRAGQLDLAAQRLEPFVEAGHPSALRLASQLAAAHRRRAEKHLRQDNAEAAWQDLLAAEALPNTGPEIAALRATLTKLGLAECRAALAAGKASHVLETLAKLRLRRAHHPEFDPLENSARTWHLANEQADRGEFALAEATATGFDSRLRAGFSQRQEKYQQTQEKLTEAVAGLKWPEVLNQADAVLAIAPNHREARLWKSKAWEALQPLTRSYHAETQVAPVPIDPSILYTVVKPSTTSDSITIAKPVGTPGNAPKRFLLWIDGVGGYLICLAPRITFGHATGHGPVDVPLFADLSRLHAELSRDGEGYLLESAREVLVNNVPVKRTLLRHGDRVTLGSTCQFVFQQPVSISPTAKLELVSGHRLPVAVDAIWLMAENLILGPSEPAHVLVPDLPAPVILFRSKEGLGIRFAGKFRVDNEPCENRASVSIPCHVTSDHFSMAFEGVIGIKL